MMLFPYPILLADIGGTNARFASIAAPGSPRTPVFRLPTQAFLDFTAAARAAVLQGGFAAPACVIIGAAGHVSERSVSLTNARWTIKGPEVAADLDLRQGLLLNDFEPLCMAVPALKPAECQPLGSAGAGTGNTLVIGPGTGLGVGALVRFDQAYLPLPSEGGHIGMGPESEAEAVLFHNLGYGADRIQAEMLLSGPALSHLYRGVAASRGLQPETLSPGEVVERARGGQDKTAVATVAWMLTFLARFAGDMALTFAATGGVFLAGGILPRLGHLLDPAAFRASFERNSVHSAMLKAIPTCLITAEDPAFIGLDALARAPDRYRLDYKARLWV